MKDKQLPDSELANAIRKLQAEIDEKYFVLKILREQYHGNDTIDHGEYIKSVAWQEIRQKVFRRDGFRCVVCGEPTNLNVHHITYENKGAEELSDLVTLCQDCHAEVHNGATVEDLLGAREIAYEKRERELEVKVEQQTRRMLLYSFERFFGDYEQTKLFAYAIILGENHIYTKLKESERLDSYVYEFNFTKSGLCEHLNSGKPISDFLDVWFEKEQLNLAAFPLVYLNLKSYDVDLLYTVEQYLYTLGKLGYGLTSHYIEIDRNPDEKLFAKQNFYRQLVYDDFYKAKRAKELLGDSK